MYTLNCLKLLLNPVAAVPVAEIDDWCEGVTQALLVELVLMLFAVVKFMAFDLGGAIGLNDPNNEGSLVANNGLP